MVSPMPSANKAPIPTALLMRPSSPSPASVTPRCKGYCMSSLSIVSTSKRTDCTITTVLLDLMEITTLSNCCFLQIRRNSMQLSTMPSGVSPYRFRILSDSDPWFTPMRMAVWLALQMLRKGTNRSSIFLSSRAYSSSVYSNWMNFRAGST